MQNGFRIGKLFGIEIFIDYSWFIIFLLITWLFSMSFFPNFFPQFGVATNIFLGVVTSLLFFTSALTHEFMHSLVAKKYGIEVRKITLFLFGGVAEIFEEPNMPSTEFKIAFAGPATSLLLAGIFWIFSYLFSSIYVIDTLFALSSTLYKANFILAIFNLLPGFPLDGGRIFRSIIWYFSKNLILATKIASSTGKFMAILLIVYGVYEIFAFGFFGGLWLVLIGVFLYQAASQSYLELIINENLKHKDVKEFMIRNFPYTEKTTKVDDLINEHFLRNNLERVPVVEGNNIVGTVSLNDIRKIDFKDSENKVEDFMKNYPSDIKINENESALNALKLIIRNNLMFVPVISGTKISGIVTLERIARYLNEQRVI